MKAGGTPSARPGSAAPALRAPRRDPDHRASGRPRPREHRRRDPLRPAAVPAHRTGAAQPRGPGHPLAETGHPPDPNRPTPGQAGVPLPASRQGTQVAKRHMKSHTESGATSSKPLKEERLCRLAAAGITVPAPFRGPVRPGPLTSDSARDLTSDVPPGSTHDTDPGRRRTPVRGRPGVRPQNPSRGASASRSYGSRAHM